MTHQCETHDSFAVGDRVTVTYGAWGRDGDIGTIISHDDHGWDWWIKFDGLTHPARFYQAEILRAA